MAPRLGDGKRRRDFLGRGRGVRASCELMAWSLVQHAGHIHLCFVALVCEYRRKG